MSKRELEMRRDWLIWKIRELGDKGLLKNLEGGPKGIIAKWPTGMPRGTNMPEAAKMQRKDIDEAVDKLDKMCEELSWILEVLENAA